MLYAICLNWKFKFRRFRTIKNDSSFFSVIISKSLNRTQIVLSSSKWEIGCLQNISMLQFKLNPKKFLNYSHLQEWNCAFCFFYFLCLFANYWRRRRRIVVISICTNETWKWFVTPKVNEFIACDRWRCMLLFFTWTFHVFIILWAKRIE